MLNPLFFFLRTLTQSLFLPLYQVRIPITDDQLEHELDELITHQQQIPNTNISLTNHQQTHSVSTSKSSVPCVYIAPHVHKEFL